MVKQANLAYCRLNIKSRLAISSPDEFLVTDVVSELRIYGWPFEIIRCHGHIFTRPNAAIVRHSSVLKVEKCQFLVTLTLNQYNAT